MSHGKIRKTTGRVRRRRSIVAAAGAIACAAAALAQPTITRIDPLKGADDIYLSGLSANGRVVVGVSLIGPAEDSGRGFRWTEAAGAQEIPLPAGITQSSAHGVNADGSVVVGTYGSGAAARPYRWSLDGGTQGLELLPGGRTAHGWGVSGDGSVVVGTCYGSSNQAFRWSFAGGMMGLGVLPRNGSSSEGRAISADGLVVCGIGRLTGSGFYFAIRWSQERGMENLGTLPDRGFSRAVAISADGSRIVGDSFGMELPRAFLWSAEAGMQDLGVLSDTNGSYAHGISEDGRFVVGVSFINGGPGRAFLWSEWLGMVSLQDYLAELGADLSGWDLYEADAISHDGSVIAGMGLYEGVNRGWIVRLDSCAADFNGDGVLNSLDFFDFLPVFFASDPRADFDGSQTVDSQDFFEFLGAFFAGC